MAAWQLDFYVIYKIGDENHVQSEIGVAVSGRSPTGLAHPRIEIIKTQETFNLRGKENLRLTVHLIPTNNSKML